MGQDFLAQTKISGHIHGFVHTIITPSTRPLTQPGVEFDLMFDKISYSKEFVSIIRRISI
jgi:hypothetical protein